MVAILLLLGQGVQGQAQTQRQSIGEQIFQSLLTSHGKGYKMLYLSGEYYTGLVLPRLSAGELAPPREHNRLSGVAIALGCHVHPFVSVGLGVDTFSAGNPMNAKPILGFVELKYRPLFELPQLQLHARASMLTLFRDRGSLEADHYSLSIGWDWHKALGMAGFTPSIGIGYMPYTTWRSPEGGAWVTYWPKPYAEHTRYSGATWSLFLRLAVTLN